MLQQAIRMTKSGRMGHIRHLVEVQKYFCSLGTSVENITWDILNWNYRNCGLAITGVGQDLVSMLKIER
jgi:hypothetical protein